MGTVNFKLRNKNEGEIGKNQIFMKSAAWNQQIHGAMVFWSPNILS